MQEVNIKFQEQELKGAYGNFMLVQFTPEEFVLDFCNVVGPQPIHVSRVITSPGHIKRISKVLNEQIKKYEETHGKIDIASEPKSKIGFDIEQNKE